MTFTGLGYIALLVFAFIGAITVAWVLRAAVRGWQRVPPRIRHGRMPLQPVEPIDTDPELARPIPEHLRQAIAERENAND